MDLPHENFSNCYRNRLISTIAPMKGVVVIKIFYYQAKGKSNAQKISW